MSLISKIGVALILTFTAVTATGCIDGMAGTAAGGYGGGGR
jgi:hypothetical protein